MKYTSTLQSAVHILSLVDSLRFFISYFTLCLQSAARSPRLRFTLTAIKSPCTSIINYSWKPRCLICCDPALSVLVMMVSRNVFHVVSALQSAVFTELARAVDVMMARAKRIYILMIKVNKLLNLFSSLSKKNRKHVL